MKYRLAFGRPAVLLACAALLASCGGGGDADPAQPQEAAPPAARPLQGVVLDDAAAGASVFLDLNNNQSLDNGEATAQADSEGRFSLEGGSLSAGQLASAMLVAEMPARAGRRAFTMLAPAASSLQPGGGSTPAVISPLTTLVAAEVMINGLTPAEAQDTVRESLSLPGKDLMADYVAQRDGQLRAAARAAAAGSIESQLAAVDDDEESDARSRIARAHRELKKRLPALLQQNAGRTATVAELRQQWTAGGPQAARKLRPAPDGYSRLIVRLDEGVADPQPVAQALAAAHGGDVRHVYRRALKGFAVDVPDASVAAFVQAAQADTRVDVVEADEVVTGGQLTQSNATWGLDRIDQRLLPLSGSYGYERNGAGVHAYIVDSGIRATHTEFTGRLAAGYSTVDDSRGTRDCHGHGTHVAGTVGGTTWGVAKGVTIVPVRVLGCDNRGSISGIIAGIDWVVANAVRPAVANVSIRANTSSSLDAAVERAVAAGITVAVAAGNEGNNACNSSPARTPGAITVGATSRTDARPTWSNYGSCLDLFAPGQDVVSAGIGSDTATDTMWGTSMATPHVAGLAALLLQENPARKPSEVAAAIKANAGIGMLKSIGSGSPNLLLYSAFLSSPVTVVEPVVTQPVVTEPVVAAPASQYMAVAALAGSSVAAGRRYWQGRVTVAVKDEHEQMVAGVVVKGGFSAGGSSMSCTTASNGTCVITSGRLGLSTSSTTFTIASLAKTGVTYMPAYNSAGSVTILAP